MSGQGIRALLGQFYRQPFTIASARSILLNKNLTKEDGHKIMAHIKKLNQQSPTVYRFYVSGIARRGDEEELKKALDEVNRIGLAGDWRDLQALGHAAKKEAQPTLDLLSTLTKEKKASQIWPADFSYCVSKFWLDKETFAKLSQLWDEMRAQGVRANILVSNVFVRGHAVQGNAEGVKNELEKMQKDGIQPNYLTYSGLVEVYARQDNEEEARKWLQEMKRQGVRADQHTYTPLIDLRIRKNDHEGAVKIIEEMKKEGLSPAARIFGAMINHKARQGDRAGAQYWLDEMMKAGWTPSPRQIDTVAQAGVQGGAQANTQENAQ
eukprot:Phypoly_transcript_11342.p1 GENE.Phypoly_transcript_11342~~Phypoly_transcript_11342.p1  ORF type:complete len:323 (+),score=87.46 Phypoly_transcript_11342:223-1191(+)